MKSRKLIPIALVLILVMVVGIWMVGRDKEDTSIHDSKVTDTIEDDNTTGDTSHQDGSLDKQDKNINSGNEKNSEKSNDLVSESEEIPEYDLPNTEEDVKVSFENLIEILYFDKGTYSDYKSLFTNPEKTIDEDAFNKFRANPDFSDKFPYSEKNIVSIMQNIVIEQVGQEYRVYYVKEPKVKEIPPEATFWKFVQKDGNVLSRNDGM